MPIIRQSSWCTAHNIAYSALCRTVTANKHIVTDLTRTHSIAVSPGDKGVDELVGLSNTKHGSVAKLHYPPCHRPKLLPLSLAASDGDK